MPPEHLQQLLQSDSLMLRRLVEQASASVENGYGELAETFFARYADELDAALTPQLLELGEALARSQQREDFYRHGDHPLRLLLDSLLQRSRTWYARDSKISLQYFERFAALIQSAINYLDSNDGNTLARELNEFCSWTEAEEKRAAKVEARLCEAEINHFKNLAAESQVVDFINQPLGQKLFPHALIDGLGILKSELLHSLFTAGSDNLFWKSWQRLLPLLGQVFASDLDEQILYRNIPIMLNELERNQSLGVSNADFYHQWVAELGEILTLVVKRQPVDCIPFPALPYPEGHSTLNTRVTDAVLQQGNSIPQGAWILFSGESEQIVRCKLALKNAEFDQLLFVDNTGRKVMVKSAKDFSMCLSTGIARLLGDASLDAIITRLLSELVEAAAHKQALQQVDDEAQKIKMQTVAELQRKLAQQKEAKLKAEQQRMRATEYAARRAAAEKAMAEARALAEEKIQRAAAQALVEERNRERLTAAETAEHLQRFQLANIQISALNLGARIEILQNNQWIKCKLAVIIAATGKYIFADNLGRKIAEMQREQLVEALINKEINLLNNGDSFDDQLAKVIRGLRKDIS